MQGQQEDSVPRTVATTATQLPRQARAGMVSGRVALVTGGTRGIGAAIGHLLAAVNESIAEVLHGTAQARIVMTP